MIRAIVVAAGRSRRMGAQKVLLPFGGATVIAHVVDQLLGGGIDGVHVVVGHEAAAIAAALAGRPVDLVTNPDDEADMLSSVRCGLRALRRRSGAVMVALGDQPAITSELVAELVRSFSATDKGILVPVHRGQRGHPIMFSCKYRDEVLTRYDDVGLRGLPRAHPQDVFELSAASDAVLRDMDSPQDYRREVRAHRRTASGE